jgi:nucleotide-binding universal stress UspA family protein
MRIDRVLFPTDLSLEAEDALRYALALARAYEASLTILHCIRPGSEAGLAGDAAKRSLEESLFARLDSAEPLSFEWEVVVIEDEDPGRAITREAAERGTDLIVMRSRRRPHRAALLGSTAELVCRSAPCPVLVMHNDERDWINGSDNKIELKRVLVAYDFSDHSELALNYGLSFAQEYQADLHLLHVLPPSYPNDPEIGWYPLGEEATYHKAARRLQQVVPAEANLWCNIKDAVSEGQPYREILNYAEESEIDLICIGTQGAGFGMQTLFGSNVDRVLRQAPCPVLVTRPLRPAKLAAGKSFAAELAETTIVRTTNR